ncbi:MAG: tetratricopeptide repeat protein [Deltaproteobacteria bacterium]|nr:tetratricopeptide repeat protein [Deltaproteobacteria bacterium]
MADDRFNWEIDPKSIERSLNELRDRLKRVADQARYTKVRFLWKGKQLLPDVPMTTLLAAEGLALLLTGPLQFLIVNLGVKAFLEVQLVHESAERVAEGVDYFQRGEVDLAEARYREALQMNPEDTAGLYHLGILLRVTGRRDEAIDCLERAARDKGHPDALKAEEALDRMRRGPRTI